MPLFLSIMFVILALGCYLKKYAMVHNADWPYAWHDSDFLKLPSGPPPVSNSGFGYGPCNVTDLEPWLLTKAYDPRPKAIQ